MSETERVGELESALITRARTLAEEYLERGRRSADHVMEDANARLRLREEREVLAAKSDAERSYRRRVQAAELKLQEEIDHLRWTLAQSVLDGLNDRLEALVADNDRYLPVLKALLKQGIDAIDAPELVIQVSRNDLEWLREFWDEFAIELAPGRKLLLSDDALDTAVGGAIIRTPDDRVRVNNTFEGRCQRLREATHEQVMESLFAGAGPMGVIFNG